MAGVPKAERAEKTAKAVEFSARGWTLRAIGSHLGHSKDTVARWINDELALRSEHRTQDKERAIATYEEIIRHGWERLATTKDTSLNVSGLLNSIKSAQERIDKITGAEAPVRSDNKHQHEHHDFSNTPTEELIDLEYHAQRVFGESGTQAR
jgi:hypothetical protein